MKRLLLTGCYFFYFITSAQIIISGKVVDQKNTPLEGASVYLNNTTIGVYTKTAGKFEFPVKPGSYDLVVSFIGYKTVQYHLVTNSYSKSLLFRLTDDNNLLEEVVLKKTKYDETWKFNLKQFTRNFLGTTKLAEKSKILNPQTLYFEFNTKTGTLTAETQEPLKIKNKALGYLVTFDLVYFSLGRNTVDYYGYTKFENLKGGKSKQRRWKKNRLRAFKGSKMEFIRSLIKGNTKEIGFNINQFRRVLNPKRPTDKQIEQARQFIKLSEINTMTYNFKKKPFTRVDSSMNILQKASLPKFKDFLYKKDLKFSEITSKKAGKTILAFNDYLSIIYTKEPEEENYVMRVFGKKRAILPVQTSSMTLRKKSVILDSRGKINNPLNAFYEGYWAFEQFADALPLDYQPD